MSDALPFANLEALAAHLRQELENKKFVLLYAYNGTGKTRLSTAFKDLGKSVKADGDSVRHALFQRIHRGPLYLGQRSRE